jgi:FdhD protein
LSCAITPGGLAPQRLGVKSSSFVSVRFGASFERSVSVDQLHMPDTPHTLTPMRKVTVTRVGRGTIAAREDVAAAEEPLDIRLQGQSFAIVMRTPGDDRALAAGFLFSERVIRRSEDIGAVEHCRHPDQTKTHHVVNVFLRGDAATEALKHLDQRRRVVANSSCGVCGRASIEELRSDIPPLTAESRVDAAVISALPGALRRQQATFDETGGLHGAGLFEPSGGLIASAEDVGRHNAVDKIVGAMLLEDRLPLPPSILMVSGRVSFEIVQKAWLAGVPVLAAVSAPTSLAIELACEAGITLVGFVRDGGFNVYAHEVRIVGV